MTNTDTDTAQRRLLETLASLRTEGLGLPQFALALHIAIEHAETTGEPALAEVYRALKGLACAVEDDHREKEKANG